MKMVFTETDVMKIITAYVSNQLQMSDSLLRARNSGYSYEKLIEVEILDRAPEPEPEPEPEPILHDVVTDFDQPIKVAE